MKADIATFLDEIDELIESGHYDASIAALRRIGAAVRRVNHITDDQRRAVRDIADGTMQDRPPPERFRSSRRYEGWAPQGR